MSQIIDPTPSLLDRMRSLHADRDEPAMVKRARLRALSKQLPLLYIILFTNITALGITHFKAAPNFLAVFAPSLALPLFVIRTIAWRHLDISRLTDADVRRCLRNSQFVTLLVGSCTGLWGLTLFPFGDVYAQAHVAFFMAVTCIGCVVCLIHLRFGVVAMAIVLTVPVTFVFVRTGNLVFETIAANYVVVSAILCVIALTHYDNFRQLIAATHDLGLLSEANRRLAEVDVLTGIANRRSFFAQVETAITGGRGTGEAFVIGLIDLDGFKPINDIYGHHAGDRVLAEIGRRLGSSRLGLLHVARLGGDEFAFMVPVSGGAGETGESERIGRRVCAALGEPIDLPTGKVRVGASIGMARFPDTASGLEQLMERADFALYFAKEESRGTAIHFSEDHARSIRERGQLEHELRRADLDAELTLVFQPLVDTRLARVVAFEALARWDNAVLGRVSPDAFIPAAERIGIIEDLTERLFRKACAAAAEWPDQIRLSFNLSTGDLAGDHASERLCRMVRESTLPPERLTFEITETAVIRDFGHSVRVLLNLRALGCRIALDDFGTGFSSLSYVHRLPLDTLKIDRSFVDALATDGVSFAVVRTIADLCANLDMSCVVEGVETQQQADLLASIGCTVMQGYLFGPPVTASVLSAGGGAPWSRRFRGGRAARLGAAT